MTRRLSILRLAVAGLLLAALAACAGETGYQKIDPVWSGKYGYRDKQIGPDEYSVTALGSPKTSPERVAMIALLRAARLTLEKGRTHFVVVKKTSKMVDSWGPEAYLPIPLPYGVIVGVPVAQENRREPIAVLLIRLLPKGAPAGADALDAAKVDEALSERLGAGA